MKRILLIVLYLTMLCLITGCEASMQDPVTLRNETGCVVAAVWIDDSGDLLKTGFLPNCSSVLLDYLSGDMPHTVVFLSDTGDILRFEGVMLTPGKTTVFSVPDSADD